MCDKKSCPSRPAYAKFDVHSHVLGPKDKHVAALDAQNVQGVLNISFPNNEPPAVLAQFEEALRQDIALHPGRFWFCSTFSLTDIGELTYPHDVIGKLTEDITHREAVAVKVWKALGMMQRDEDGRFMFVDDELFRPIFDFLARHGVPVILHMADPRAGWEPLDPASPHYGYFRAHPEFHWHGNPDKPSHEEILAHRNRLIKRYPNTPFVCCHLASLEHNVEAVAAFLDAHPNALVDTAARAGDLARQPVEKVREFFTRYRERVMFGTDIEVDWRPEAAESGHAVPSPERLAERYAEQARFYEETLALRPDVLQAFYRDNALRVFRLPA